MQPDDNSHDLAIVIVIVIAANEIISANTRTAFRRVRVKDPRH